MREELEALVADHLDGTLDAPGRDRLARELEGDAQARAEFGDQLQVHHRLAVALEKSDAFTGSVVRELRLLGDSERFSQGVVNQIKRKSRIRAWELAAAALILAVLGILLARGGGDAARPAAGPAQVLLVVGRLPLEAGDARVRERLETLGWRITTKTAADVQSSDARGRALVAISSTALARDVLEAPAELTAKFRDTAVPVVTWEPRLFYDLGMIAGSVYHKDWGAAKDQTRLAVTNAKHPLAAGFSGPVTVTSGPDHLSWGRARADAIKIATIEGDSERAAIFAYERGARMPGLVAPARRVGLFLFDATALQLTPQGWALFDAAVRWSVQ
jgi:hypothetical protein